MDLIAFVLAQNALVAFGAFTRDRASVVALGVVATADKPAGARGFQVQLPRAAFRAEARVAAIFARRIELGGKRLVQDVQHFGNAQIGCLGNRRREIAPEAIQKFLIVLAACTHIIELVFQRRGEVILHVAFEEVQQKDGHDPPLVLGEQAVLVLADIFAVLDRGDDAGIGRRAANAQFFHTFDQRGLGIARRGLGVVLQRQCCAILRQDRTVFACFFSLRCKRACEFQRLALHDLRQALVVLVHHIVAAFFVDAHETVKQHHLTGGTQHHLLVVRADIDRGALQPGTGHLAGQCALPDQIIKLALIVLGHLQARGVAAHVGGADTFVRFLGVFGFVFIDARLARHIVLAVAFCDFATRGSHGLGGHVDTVGPHIGDQTGLIEALRRVHALLCTHAELAARFLLQGRSHERRRRITRSGFGLDRQHRHLAACNSLHRKFGCSGIGEAEFIELLAAQNCQARLKRLTARGGEICTHRPVFLRVKRLDLHLTFDDQAQADRLHAPGRPRAGQFAPQHGRQVETHQIVQRPAGQIGLHQRHIHIAGIFHRLSDGILGDRVEGHAFDIGVFLDRPALCQRFL